MKQLSPRELATTVAKQSTGVSVRIGQTNGAPVLHLIRRKERTSRTIPATQVDWNIDPWNEASPYNTKEETA